MRGKGPRLWLAAALGLAAGALAGCGEASAPPFAPSGPSATEDGAEVPDVPGGAPRLVVLYATCTLNPGFLSPYEPSVGYTPALAAFAREGIVFRRHVTEAGQSGVAYASLYSSTHADRHGVYHHPRRLPEELYLVSEAFADAGYEPWFWSGQPMASAELGYGQGIPAENVFHRHVMFTPRAKELSEDFLAGVTGNGPELERVLAKLVADRKRRAFLQIGFTITHELYHEYADLEEIESFRARHPEHATDLTRAEIERYLALFEEHRQELQFDHPGARRRLGLDEDEVRRLDQVLRLAYRACVAQLDRYFARFLETIRAAGLEDEALIAFTADHGESFYEPDELFHWTHGLELSPEVLGVPWILRGAGLPPGEYAAVTRSIDVFPTLAGLCGLRLPAGVRLEGTDLTPALRDHAQAPELVAYAHTSTLGPDRIRRYRREGHELLLSFLPEADPRHIWVGARQGDLWFRLRPIEPGSWGVTAHDLSLPAQQRRDVFDPGRKEHRALRESLERYKRRLVEAFDAREPIPQREILERLQSLGYLGADGGG